MEKIKQITEKIKSAIHHICDTIKNIKSDYDFYRGLWEKPQGKAAVKKIMDQSMVLLKKVRPFRIEGEVLFGTGDPAGTGQILGAIAAVYGFIPEKLKIVPDFEEKRFEGNVRAKGKLRLIHVAIIAIRLIADKNVRYLVRKIQSKEGTENEQ